MEIFFNQITTLIVQPTGSMVYHLVIAFVFIIILQPALNFLYGEKEDRKRLLAGILLLIATRIVLFIFSLLALMGSGGMGKTLGVVEIAVNALDICIIIWLFAFKGENRTGDIGLAIFGLLILAAGTISIIYWNLQGETGTFNQSSLAFLWQLATLAIILVGLYTLYKSTTQARIQGMIFLGILLIGESFQTITATAEGNFFPISRLVHLIAFPLLTGIMQNYLPTGIAHAERATQGSDGQEEPILFPGDEELDLQVGESGLSEGGEPSVRPISKALDLQIFQNSVALAATSDPKELCQLFTRLTAHALLADHCILLNKPDENQQIHMVCGYDLIVQDFIPGDSFDSSLIPRIDKLFKDNRPVHVVDQGAERMDEFAEFLQVDEINNLMAYPVTGEDSEVIAAVVLVSPYSKHVWNADDQEYLKASIDSISLLLQKAIAYQVASYGEKPTSSASGLIPSEVEKLVDENETLTEEISELKQKLEELPKAPPEVEAVLEEKKSIEFVLDRLKEENETLNAEYEKVVEKNSELAEQLSQMLEHQQNLEDHVELPQETKAQIDALANANQELAQQRADALNEIDDLTIKLNEIGALNGTIAKERDEYVKLNKELTDKINNLNSQITDLSKENEKLLESLNNIKMEQKETDTASAEEIDKNEQLQKELDEAIQQAESFEKQLNDANESLQSLLVYKSKTNGQRDTEEQNEVIASIAQELRQPMSSISGYTDLLISESVGILGALQKKFLERVKASIDRMNQLIDDLIQISTIDSGSFLFTVQPLELMEAIDSAIEATSAQFREKELSMRVNIGSDLPKLHTDKDALQQILLHLLQNAGTATPSNGEIFLAAKLYDKSKEDVIQLSVTDTGEGIPKEDLPRVFSRLYRADNPLIQGVGDTGVGLSIAKTLTEALGGRIWVESEVGSGSTYSILLPTTSPAVSQQEG